MDDQTRRKIQISEIRYSGIERSLRCLDCDKITGNIEHVVSPVSNEQRNMIKTLIRKGLTNDEVFDQLINIFGPQVLLSYNMYSDRTSGVKSDYINQKFYQNVVLTGSSIIGVFLGIKGLRYAF